MLKNINKKITKKSKLRHPNIVPFLGACVEPFCLLTEFMSKGCLFNVLEDNSISIDWHLKLRIITDIAKGMVYLHTRSPPIIHRDIKSLNVLVPLPFFLFLFIIYIFLLLNYFYKYIFKICKLN